MKVPRTPVALLACLLLAFTSVLAQDSPSSKDKEIYNQLKAFSLTGGVIDVKGVVLKRVRSQITLDGIVYLSAPVNGAITGAVFIGEGKFVAESPTSDFERDNVKRLLGAEIVESDFKTAVFRFTDDTATQLGTPKSGPANDRAQKLAQELDERMLREVGANLPSRLAISLLNAEKPGFFFAHFEGGKRGRFSMVLDHQNRIPVAQFDINAGEKGLIWSYNSDLYSPEVWLAFYSLEDYQRGAVQYSDANDQIDIKSYRMEIDLREHKQRVKLNARIEAEPYQPNVRAIPFKVGEDLGEYESHRLKKQMRIISARRGGVELPVVQEKWEGGFTVFLPESLKAREKLELDLTLEGDFMRDSESVEDCHYPRSNSSWFPRHGYLDRATFDLTFHHPKRHHVASVGARISEEIDPEDKDALVSKYQMMEPVALVTFALGPFKTSHRLDQVGKGWRSDAVGIQFTTGRVHRDQRRLHPGGAQQRCPVLYSALRQLSLSCLRGRLSPVWFWAGFPVVVDDPAGRSRQQVYVPVHRSRDGASVVGQYRCVALVSRPVAQRRFRRILRNSLHRTARESGREE
jgi:hypothetical protein